MANTHEEYALDEKQTGNPHHDERAGCSGITLYIRRCNGITRSLFNARKKAYPVFVEGPYHVLPIPDLAARPKLVAIAGGVGISTVLPIITSHALQGSTSLYWSSRSHSLVDHVDLSSLRAAGVRVHLRILDRWSMDEVLLAEVHGPEASEEVTVIVSGPSQMADDVRAAVSKCNNMASTRSRLRGDAAITKVRLVEECFSW